MHSVTKSVTVCETKFIHTKYIKLLLLMFFLLDSDLVRAVSVGVTPVVTIIQLVEL